MIHPLRSYVSHTIVIEGGVDEQWTGYRVFIRDKLYDYESVAQWREHDASLIEYVYRDYPRGSAIVTTADHRYHSMDEDSGDLIEWLTSRNELFMNEDDDNEVFSTVRLYLRSRDVYSSPVYGPNQDDNLDQYDENFDHDDLCLSDFIDRNHPLTLIEEERTLLLKKERDL